MEMFFSFGRICFVERGLLFWVPSKDTVGKRNTPRRQNPSREQSSNGKIHSRKKKIHRQNPHLTGKRPSQDKPLQRRKPCHRRKHPHRRKLFHKRGTSWSEPFHITEPFTRNNFTDSKDERPFEREMRRLRRPSPEETPFQKRQKPFKNG